MLSVVVNVCAAVSRSAPPLRFKLRSLRSKPATGSLKTMVIRDTEEFRGSGATAVTAAVGRVVSVRPGFAGHAGKHVAGRIGDPAAERKDIRPGRCPSAR